MVLPLLAVSCHTAYAQNAAQTEGIPRIRFADQPDVAYVGARELADATGARVYWDTEKNALLLNDKEVPAGKRRALPGQSQAVVIGALKKLGMQVHWESSDKPVYITTNGKTVTAGTSEITVTDGVTFADTPGTLYTPLRGLGTALKKQVSLGPEGKTAYWNGRAVAPGAQRRLPDGTRLISLKSLGGTGRETVAWSDEDNAARVTSGDRTALVRQGKKVAAVSVDRQRLRAWQGNLLVLDTRVSTGRRGFETPRGSFRAGPLKTPMLISRKYNNAEMPWSVQVRGDVVIHGYPSVPPRAASHGCVRMPLTGANPAHWFYTWIDVGTPIEIHDDWSGGVPKGNGSTG